MLHGQTQAPEVGRVVADPLEDLLDRAAVLIDLGGIDRRVQAEGVVLLG